MDHRFLFPTHCLAIIGSTRKDALAIHRVAHLFVSSSEKLEALEILRLCEILECIGDLHDTLIEAKAVELVRKIVGEAARACAALELGTCRAALGQGRIMKIVFPIEQLRCSPRPLPALFKSTWSKSLEVKAGER